MKAFLAQHPFILAEAAVVESLRRNPALKLHPLLAHSTLLLDEKGSAAMRTLYQSFIDIAKKADIPLKLSSPSWRINKERAEKAGINSNLNKAAIDLLHELRQEQGNFASSIKIGGLLGCKNDCYLPEEALSEVEAVSFHSWQIEQLLEGQADFLQAVTLPSVKEARGIARALEPGRDTPYFLSFVINRQGTVLDKTPLIDAINQIDDLVENPPLGYFINCAYPSFLCADKQPSALFDRLIGYQANGSSLDHCDLEGAAELQQNSVSEWVGSMHQLHQQYGLQILGGCCGTNTEHLTQLVQLQQSATI